MLLGTAVANFGVLQLLFSAAFHFVCVYENQHTVTVCTFHTFSAPGVFRRLHD